MLQNVSAFSPSYWSEEEYDELFSNAFHDLFMTTLCLPMAAFQSSHLLVVTIPRESSHLVPLLVALAESSHLLAVTLPIIPRGASLGSIDRIQRIVRLPYQLPHFMASSSPISLSISTCKHPSVLILHAESNTPSTLSVEQHANTYYAPSSSSAFLSSSACIATFSFITTIGFEELSRDLLLPKYGAPLVRCSISFVLFVVLLRQHF